MANEYGPAQLYYWMIQDFTRFLGFSVGGIVRVIQQEKPQLGGGDLASIIDALDRLAAVGLIETGNGDPVVGSLLDYLHNDSRDFSVVQVPEWEERLQGA